MSHFKRHSLLLSSEWWNLSYCILLSHLVSRLSLNNGKPPPVLTCGAGNNTFHFSEYLHSVLRGLSLSSLTLCQMSKTNEENVEGHPPASRSSTLRSQPSEIEGSAVPTTAGGGVTTRQDLPHFRKINSLDRHDSLRRDDVIHHASSSRSMVKPVTRMIRRCLVPPAPNFHPELPPEGLTQTEKKALVSVSRLWESAKTNFKPPLSVEEELYYSDRAKVRYLRARDLDPRKALSMMIKTVIFRRKIGELRPTQKMSRLNQKGALYRRGFDSHHRPLLYIRLVSLLLLSNHLSFSSIL